MAPIVALKPLMSDAQFAVLDAADRKGFAVRGEDGSVRTLLSVGPRRGTAWLNLRHASVARNGQPAGRITGGTLTPAGKSALRAERERRSEQAPTAPRVSITAAVDPFVLIGNREARIPF